MKHVRLVSIDPMRAVCAITLDTALDAAENPHWRVDDAYATVSRSTQRDLEPWGGISVTVLSSDGTQRLHRRTIDMLSGHSYGDILAIIADVDAAVAHEGLSIHSHSMHPFVSAAVFAPPAGTSGEGQWWGHLVDDRGDRVSHPSLSGTDDIDAVGALSRLCSPYGIAFDRQAITWREAGRGETCGRYVTAVEDDRPPIDRRLADPADGAHRYVCGYTAADVESWLRGQGIHHDVEAQAALQFALAREFRAMRDSGLLVDIDDVGARVLDQLQRTHTISLTAPDGERAR